MTELAKRIKAYHSALKNGGYWEAFKSLTECEGYKAEEKRLDDIAFNVYAQILGESAAKLWKEEYQWHAFTGVLMTYHAHVKQTLTLRGIEFDEPEERDFSSFTIINNIKFRYHYGEEPPHTSLMQEGLCKIWKEHYNYLKRTDGVPAAVKYLEDVDEIKESVKKETKRLNQIAFTLFEFHYGTKAADRFKKKAECSKPKHLTRKPTRENIEYHVLVKAWFIHKRNFVFEENEILNYSNLKVVE